MSDIGTIPYDFVAKNAKLAWQEVRFGMDKGFIGRETPIELAMQAVLADEENPDVLELASLTTKDSVGEIVSSLADAEKPVEPRDVERTWLFLVLAWLLSRKEEYSDSLGLVEKVYADFDYPEEISAFVRYMPMHGEDLGVEANEARLFDRWSEYVTEEAKRRSA